MLYTISEGAHFSSIIPTLHSGITEMYGTITFDSSCNYDLSANLACAKDTNKAIGFGYGVTPEAHKKWSIRLGWRVVNGNLILLLYVYNNGVRTITRLGYAKSYKFDVEYPFQIINDRATKTATVKVGSYFISIPFDKPATWGVILKPYFGGDCTAPHDMHINIQYTTF